MGCMAKKEHLDTLFKIQKCFVRLINKMPFRSESSPLFLRNKILKLNDVLELELVKEMFKYKKRMLPNKLFRLYEPKTHTHSTRNSETPNIVKHKSSIFNSSFLCKTVQVWGKNCTKYRELATIGNLTKKFKYEKFAAY